MSLVATVVDPLTGPAPSGWDEFITAQRLHPVWDSRLLRTADWCAQTPSSMVLVREQGSDEPVAAFHTRHLGLTRPWRFARPGHLPICNVTECRTVPETIDAGLVFAADAGERDRLEAVRVFEAALRRRTGSGGRAISYRRLPERYLAVIPAAGRIRLRLSPRMVLDNQWPDLASYLADLPGKWRSQLRKLHESVLADHTIRFELGGTVDSQEACWLAEVVRGRYAARAAARPPLPAGYFAQLSQASGVRFLTYRDRQGRLLGYSAVHDNGSELLLICWGSRGVTDGWRANLYFDQYLRLIELMVGAGRRRVLLGPGMQRIKARFGAVPQPRWGLVGLR